MLHLDGAHFILDGRSEGQLWTEMRDAESLEVVTRLHGRVVTPTRRMDGRPITLASQPTQDQTQLAVLDRRSFEVVHSWSVNGYAAWLTLL